MRADLHLVRDEQLWQSVAESSEDAFRALYERYQRPLFTKAVHFLGCENLAKDCLHEVFVSIWVKRETLAIGNLHSYLHQAVRFRALKHLKQDRFTAPLDERLPQLIDDRLASDALEYKELSSCLQHRIDALPPDQRRIFLLHRDHHLTYVQIADRLHLSVKTVEKKMTLSLKFLRGYKLPSVSSRCVSK